jgi:hypothetical protein
MNPLHNFHWIQICWLEADVQTVLTSLHLPNSVTTHNESLWDLKIGSPSKMAQMMMILTAVFMVSLSPPR